MQPEHGVEQIKGSEARILSHHSRGKRLLSIFGLPSTSVGLHKTPEERAEHLQSIQRLIRDPDRWTLHGWLHQNLSILDDKANAILAVNSITLATFTIFYANLSQSSPTAVKIGLLAAFLLLVWSTVPLARLVFVYWSTTHDFDAPEQMLNDLLRVRDERSKIVRASILKGAAAFCLYAIVIIIDVLSKLV